MKNLYSINMIILLENRKFSVKQKYLHDHVHTEKAHLATIRFIVDDTDDHDGFLLSFLHIDIILKHQSVQL